MQFTLCSAHAAQKAQAPAVSGIYGSSGLWKVLTAETIPARRISFATSYERQHRNPGDLAITTLRAGAAAGITDRLEGAVHIETYRHVRVGLPEQLSFGQQALGFFGEKIPGSPPLPSERMPGSSRVPQLRSPPAPAGVLTGRAGYYNLLPFAGLVETAGAPGLVTLSAKYNLLAEARNAPLGFAVHSYFSIPIYKGIEYLMRHPVGTADLHFGVDLIASKEIGDTAQVHGNAGFRHISQPAHASVFRLSDELPLGVGVVIPRSSRLQFVMESTAEVFVGNHTPNTTFGPADPLDITAGLRVHLDRSFTVNAGYQRLIPSESGKHGFAISVSYNTLGF
ncbi:MAG: hypothetical protein HY646_16930 [Acidobacteria bacterium]|nr:hypothetical protein [Acidobacteriota bacterium]